MASAPVSSRENCSMEEHLTCSICMDTFEDPVTTDCGHSFCKKCLNLSYEHTEKVCPICKKPLGRTPDVNIVLRDIVQQQKLKKTEEEDEDIYTGEDEKVPFDIYTEPKLKAEESCLVCPAPYCETHLQNNSTERLKGHKLVAENLDERACCCVHFLVEDPEEVVSTKDKQEKKKSLHLCQVCGWSNLTTYQGLRIHQGRKGCTPKGVSIPETEQCNWQKPEEMEMKVDQRRSQPAERLTFKEENLPPSRNICTNSAAATATINEGNSSTFATSQCSSLRTTKSKSAHQQQYFSTLPKVKKELPISPPPVVRPKPQIADRRDLKDNQRAAAGTIKVEPISPFATSHCSPPRTTKSKSANQQQYFSTLPKVKKELPISPPPVVRPKPQIADRRAMKDNQRATAGTIKEEPKSSFAAPQLPFQRATRSKSAHQQQYFSTLPQVKKELPIAPPPIVRPKPQIADRRDLKDNQRAAAGTIKVEPISPVAIPPRPFLRPANPQSGHQLQDLFGVQGGQERLQLELQQKIHIRNQRMSNIRPEDRVYENIPGPTSTSSQTDTAAPAAETTAEEEPRSNCETAESDFSTGMKVKELAWMFSATATQEAGVQPKEKHRGKQTPSQVKSLALRFSAATVQETAVHPEERDKEGPKLSQTVPDSASTDQANNAASAEATRKEDPISSGETAESDFSTGMKVRDLARMFSATTTQETAGRPQGKHREKQTPSQAKLLAPRFSATTAQRPAVQGMEKDLEDQKLSQKMPDSAGATNKMNPAAAEATTAEDAQSSFDTAQLLDFSTGVKVKELARMFSATTTQKTAVRPKEKH